MNYFEIGQGLFRIFFHSLLKVTGMEPYELLVSIMFAMLVVSGTMILNIVRVVPHALMDICLRLNRMWNA